MKKEDIKVVGLKLDELKEAGYNPRKIDDETLNQLMESMRRFSIVEPIVVNINKARYMIIVGGHQRVVAAKKIGLKEIPAVLVDIADIEREKELCIRLNKNVGEFDDDLLAEFSEEFLVDIGFSSEELDDIFEIDESPEMFDLEKELKKLDIEKVDVQKGDIYQLGKSKLMCGDSTVEADMLRLMDGEKADMCLTDPPYILDYLKAKRHGKAVTGFGAKKNRRYLETDVLPDNFTELWMGNISKVAKEDFSIIVYENWKNLRTIWGEMEKYWKVKNMIVWHLPNRTQGFAAKYKFFSKHDIAMVGTSEGKEMDLGPEEELLQNEYETALFAVNNRPHWEGYRRGKKICPTDFIEFNACDSKSSGQSIIFGTKPLEILIPYVKVLTKRGDLIVEPFGGSGSTLIASEKMKRRCYLMEKSPVYAEVIINRWSKLTGQKPVRIGGKDEKSKN